MIYYHIPYVMWIILPHAVFRGYFTASKFFIVCIQHFSMHFTKDMFISRNCILWNDILLHYVNMMFNSFARMAKFYSEKNALWAFHIFMTLNVVSHFRLSVYLSFKDTGLKCSWWKWYLLQWGIKYQITW